MPGKTYKYISEMKEAAAKAREDAKSALSPSWLTSWTWAAPSFTDAMEWLSSHPGMLRRGEYISDTPGKDVWRLQLPEAFGSIQIVYKKTDGYSLPMKKRLGISPSLNEVLNISAFGAMDIAVPDVLACGENREFGVLRSSFIITRYIRHSRNGSALMPEGALHENEVLRMGFGRNLMKYLALIHLAGFSNDDFHPRKILFPKKCYEKNPLLYWVDAETCRFRKNENLIDIIPKDLVHIFVALRLSTREIQELCKCYLDSNPYCGHTPQSLWQTMTSMPIGS